MFYKTLIKHLLLHILMTITQVKKLNILIGLQIAQNNCCLCVYAVQNKQPATSYIYRSCAKTDHSYSQTYRS